MKRNTENFTTTTTTTLCQFGPPAVMNRRQKPRLNEHPDPYGEKGDREREGIRDNRPAVLKKEAVTLAKQRCTTSSSVLYQRIHGNGAFLPSKKKKKTAIVCADSPLRTENGRPLGAEVAHMQMMRMPTCRLKPTFSFSLSTVGADSPARRPHLPAAPRCVHDMIWYMQADSLPPPLTVLYSPCVCVRKWILNECLCSIILWGALAYWHVNKMPPLKKMWSHQGDDVELK